MHPRDILRAVVLSLPILSPAYGQTDNPDVGALNLWQIAAVLQEDLRTFDPAVAATYNTPLKFKSYTNSPAGQERLRQLRLLKTIITAKPMVFRVPLTAADVGEFSIEERSFLVRWTRVSSSLPCYGRPETRKPFERIPLTDREVHIQNLPWIDPDKAGTEDPSQNTPFLFPIGPMTDDTALSIEGVNGISLEIVYLITGVEFPEDGDETGCRPFVLVGDATAFRLVDADGKTLFSKNFPPRR